VSMQVFNVEHYIHLSFQYDCSLEGFDVSMQVFNVEHYLHLSFQYDCSLVGFDVSMEVFNVDPLNTSIDTSNPTKLQSY
jgi:uncharacterized protein (UPF0212 family)